MLNKLRQIKQIRELQSSFAKEKVEAEKKGTKVVINGKMEIEEVKLNPELETEDQEKIIRDCINDAMDKMKALLAQKMSQTPGMGL